MEPSKPPPPPDDEGAGGGVEPHPFPDPAWVRIGSPVAALVLALVIFAGMFALAGDVGAGWAVLIASLVLQLGLMAGRGLAMRRAARLEAPALRWHQFVFMWSSWAGGTYLLGLGQDGDVFAVWLQVAGGLVVALVLVGALQLLEPRHTRVTAARNPDERTQQAARDRE